MCKITPWYGWPSSCPSAPRRGCLLEMLNSAAVTRAQSGLCRLCTHVCEFPVAVGFSTLLFQLGAALLISSDNIICQALLHLSLSNCGSRRTNCWNWCERCTSCSEVEAYCQVGYIPFSLITSTNPVNKLICIKIYGITPPSDVDFSQQLCMLFFLFSVFILLLLFFFWSPYP